MTTMEIQTYIIEKEKELYQLYYENKQPILKGFAWTCNHCGKEQVINSEWCGVCWAGYSRNHSSSDMSHPSSNNTTFHPVLSITPGTLFKINSDTLDLIRNAPMNDIINDYNDIGNDIEWFEKYLGQKGFIDYVFDNLDKFPFMQNMYITKPRSFYYTNYNKTLFDIFNPESAIGDLINGLHNVFSNEQRIISQHMTNVEYNRYFDKIRPYDCTAEWYRLQQTLQNDFTEYNKKTFTWCDKFCYSSSHLIRYIADIESRLSCFLSNIVTKYNMDQNYPNKSSNISNYTNSCLLLHKYSIVFPHYDNYTELFSQGYIHMEYSIIAESIRSKASFCRPYTKSDFNDIINLGKLIRYNFRKYRLSLDNISYPIDLDNMLHERYCRENEDEYNELNYTIWKCNTLEQYKLKQERLIQNRIEQIKLSQERLSQEKVDQERLIQERLEQIRLFQEKIEQIRLSYERLEQEKLEQERLEQERLERKRLEQERIEQERLEKERIDRERIRREKIEQEERLERIRLEQERRERERLEGIRLEQERRERERLEQERIRQERIRRERLERDRLARERVEQERVIRLERERVAQLEQARLRYEHLQRQDHDILERDRLARERLEQERVRQERRAASVHVDVPQSINNIEMSYIELSNIESVIIPDVLHTDPLYNIVSQMQCSICLTNQINITFRCSHSFCNECVKQLLYNKNHILKTNCICPKCRQPLVNSRRIIL
jgi:hypothetical protein